MGVADWIILLFLLFSVATAAWQGFFQEAFGLAGLVVGYMVAAWCTAGWRIGLIRF